MSGLTIQPVTSRKQRKLFLELPWSLYRDDPNWMPPLRLNQKQLVNYKHHAFYDNAECQTFLALQNGRPCGRIAAIVNHAHNRCHNERRGFFGFFESIDDQQVANGLFDASRLWLADRDMHCIRGPMNPSQNYECGLLVEGFDTPPYFMMTYNKPYYGQLVENYGFRKSQDLFAFRGDVSMLDTVDSKLDFIYNAAIERFDLVIRPMDRSRFRQEVETFLKIYNESMTGSWGFVPLSDGEVHHSAGTLRYLIDPDLSTVIEAEGKPVGMTFGLLDYNPRIKAIDGRLLPLGFWKLIRNRREIKRIRFLTANVLPAYQRWGLGLVMLGALVPCGLKWGMQEAEFSWVAESNSLSRRSLERGGAECSKTYRIYDWQLDELPHVT